MAAMPLAGTLTTVRSSLEWVTPRSVERSAYDCVRGAALMDADTISCFN
jgi:hypothetical protein